MTTLAMLCVIYPASYGCIPMRSIEECWTAHEMLAPVVIVSSCEAGEYMVPEEGVIFAPLPPRKPEVKS